MEYTIDMREQLIDIHTQVAVTKDNVALHIDGCLYIQVEDPQKAAYNVEDYEEAIVNLA
jgi:regulator of protease activity HflC (stomatin/prohibitin superfamily)